VNPMPPATDPARSRPRVHVNCAVSADGRLAYAGGRRALLSGPRDLQRVQALRAGSDAILVGVGTVLLDDPSLRVRWDLLGRPPGLGPMRVVLDSRGRTPEAARVLDRSQPTVIVVGPECSRIFPEGVHVLRPPHGPRELPAMLEGLSELGLRTLLVEGGAQVIASFVRARLIDALTVFVAPTLIGGASAPPMMAGPETLGAEDATALRLDSVERLDDGVLLTWGLRPGSS
jgi:2,5-diamino-6-(ribosylamino)-4(3H)-pyrimidinone 5'-phosphate reductase